MLQLNRDCCIAEIVSLIIPLFDYFQFPNDSEVALRIFIAALTDEMHDLEFSNYDEDVQATSILEKEKEISKRYIFLAGVVKDDPDLERECILTAFSLNPSEESFELVSSLNESRNKCMAPTDEQTQRKIAWNRCVPESICPDLPDFIRSRRIKTLSWDIPWPQLKINCEKLVRTEEKRRFVENSTATANEKLQYINFKLNYEDFKDLTPQEVPGIHQGFEIYMLDSDTGNAKKSDSDQTDSAPESKELIKRERNRKLYKKRALKKRAQRSMDGPSEKKRRIVRSNGDSLKPSRPQQKLKSSTPKSQLSAVLASDMCDIKTEIFDTATVYNSIKTEPLDTATVDSSLKCARNGDDDDPNAYSHTQMFESLPETSPIVPVLLYSGEAMEATVVQSSDSIADTQVQAEEHLMEVDQYVPGDILIDNNSESHVDVSASVSTSLALKAKNPLLLYRKPKKKSECHITVTEHITPATEPELQLTSTDFKVNCFT